MMMALGGRNANAEARADISASFDEQVKLQPRLLKSLTRNSRVLATKIAQLQRTNARRAKLDQDIQALLAKSTPPGYRVFNPSFETPVWDRVMAEKTQSFTIELIASPSSPLTYRDVIRGILQVSQEHMVKVEKQVLNAHRLDLRAATSIASFEEQCLGACAFVSTIARIHALDLDLELPGDDMYLEGRSDSLAVPILWHADEATVRRQIKDLYKRTVARAADKVATERSAQDAQGKRRSGGLQSLATHAPMDFPGQICRG